MGSNEEIKRILDMIESGKITAAEAARLLETARPAQRAAENKVCPFCAENIPAHNDPCPECGSHLKGSASHGDTGTGFHALSTFSKSMVIYTLVVSGFVLATGFVPGNKVLYQMDILNLLLAGLGLTAGILMFKGKAAGWGLAMLWAALQIITIVVHSEVINQQVFHFGINFHTNGQGLGINLVGIILLILLIKAKPAGN